MTDKEGDLYGTSDDTLRFVPTERDEDLEKHNILNANSRSARFERFIDRLFVQLWQRIHQFIAVAWGFIEKIPTFFQKGIDIFKVFLYNVYCHINNHERINTVKKQDNKVTENTNNTTEKKANWFSNIQWRSIGRGIMGLGLLFAVASMLLSAVIIYMGTGKEMLPKVIIAPMTIYALIILVKQFTTFSKQGDK